MKKLNSLIILLATIGLLSGCGGGSDTTNNGTEEVQPIELVDRVEIINPEVSE